MTDQPAHDSLTTQPFWKVQTVFDPEGTGKDFAYTIGLHTRGIPELHIWARPTLGEDPGHDWMLSTNDRIFLLDELAQLLLDGRLEVGAEVTREYDGGMATLTFRVDPAGDKEELEAYGVPPGADVLPIPWSLCRVPEGQLTPLTEDAEVQARARYSALLQDLASSRLAPPGWALPEIPTYAIDQRFGPLTPVVLARAAQLWKADDDAIIELLHAAATADACGGLSTSTSLALAVARPVGRRHCLEALQDAVHDLVASLTERPPAQRRWRAIVAGADPEWWREQDQAGRARLQRSFSRLLLDVVSGCLMVEAVADAAGEELLLRARGPWLSGFRREPVLSHPAWTAAPEVLNTVAQVLAPLDARGLTIVAGIHRIACQRGITEAPGYEALCYRLMGWATISATACPWVPLLAGLPGWSPLLESLPGASVGKMPDLEGWATCVASALTHRARLSADEIATFARPYAVDLPHLATVLNRPVAVTA